MDFEDQNQYSSASSSSSSSLEVVLTTPNPNSATISTHKKRGGRKIFKETRHPEYRGVRRRNGSKWVCEVREPKTKSRIWLGTYDNPEMAAVAHDVAVLTLRGENAPLNFPDSAARLPRVMANYSHSDIRKAAYRAAKNFSFSPPSSTSSSDILRKTEEVKPPSIDLGSEENVYNSSLQDHSCKNMGGTDQSRHTTGEYRTNEFIDEEAMFNMPGLINSMAEGMLLTPPAMKKGFKWSHDDIDDQVNEETYIGLNLWGD